MEGTLKLRTNVNRSIKDGLPKVKDRVARVLEIKGLMRQALVNERELVNQVLAPKLNDKGGNQRKRARSSPADSPDLPELANQPLSDVEQKVEDRATQMTPPTEHTPALKKRPQQTRELASPPTVDGSSSMNSAVAPSNVGNWEKRLSRKEKRKLRRIEAVSNKEPAARDRKVADPALAREVRGKAPPFSKKPRPRKPRAEAILINLLGGRSFAEVLGRLKSKAKPEETDTIVKSIRCTQNGKVLLELGKSGDRVAFAAKVREALGDHGTVQELEPRTSVEIRDLDGLSTEAEVREAINKAIPDIQNADSLKVWLTRPNRSEQRIAIAEMRNQDASKLLNLTHLRIGWVNCRLRRRVVVPRCFRCLGFGHSSRNCKGPDLSKNCFRCGGSGHNRKNCTAAERCFLCAKKGQKDASLGHIPGAGRCSVFKAALDLEKARSRKTADSLLDQLAQEIGADTLLISEQYRDRDPHFWFPDSLGTAACWVRNSTEAPVQDHGRGRGFVWVRCRDVTFFSVYLTPNEPIREFRLKLDRLEDSVRGTVGHVVVAGDFNARAVEWGMTSTNSRGKYILDFAARAGLVVLNEGDTPTFRRPGMRGTIPDISFSSESLLAGISNWRVIEDLTASDHQYIVFDILDEHHNQAPVSRSGPRRWNTDKLDVEKFTDVISRGALVNSAAPVDAEALVTSTMELIVSACDQAMPRRGRRRDKQAVYWWTLEISNLRKTCLKARRAAMRARRFPDSAAYRAAKKALRRAIIRSKQSAAAIYSASVDESATMGCRLEHQAIGPPAYRITYPLVLLLVSSSPANSAPDYHLPSWRAPPWTGSSPRRIVFPSHPRRPFFDYGEVGDIPLFSIKELESSVLSLKNRKAPGPDGIPSEALKKVFSVNPLLLLRMYNTCLCEGVFPTPWKRARLVLISKGKCDPNMPSSYRPLYMLDVAGKLFEKLIRCRLMSAAGDLSPRQYGFRKGRSTIDAISEVHRAVERAESYNHYSRRIVLLVTLDVKNAFNSARWVDMLSALRNSFRVPAYLLRLIEDYLRCRTLNYETKDGSRTMDVTSGAAQGSILGPDLWNAA
ncbi:uncharacterized protein LOC128998059 [Macrosteles quadrilineatus]|uniref:uncharacterized protein LOC128998059 n=1 Tax=Macrosteles quadrilineatus TaxID=74068 RepID=UPI0023E2642F|nr:uncharacterized protein LOC128998059 [Macrosteles quadrilineatus]